jgi:lysine/ornithine N-monooxygenase
MIIPLSLWQQLDDEAKDEIMAVLSKHLDAVDEKLHQELVEEIRQVIYEQLARNAREMHRLVSDWHKRIINDEDDVDVLEMYDAT